MVFIIYLLLAIGILIIDRVTKIIALSYCFHSSYEVNSFLFFEVVFNRGVSWGLFSQARSAVVFLIPIVQLFIVVILSWYAYKSYKRNENIAGYICVVSGTISNIFDRLFYPGVIDFITIGSNGIYWPSFNIADAAIIGGIGMIILTYKED
jgi:signal peptidase II